MKVRDATRPSSGSLTSLQGLAGSGSEWSRLATHASDIAR